MFNRMGVFCFRRHRWVLIAWLVVMAAGGAVMGPVFSGLGSGNALSGSEVKRASDAINDGTDKGLQYFVLVHHVDASSPTTQAVLDKAEADTRAIEGVKSVSGPIHGGQDPTTVAISVTLVKADSQYKPYHASRDRMQQLTTQLPGSSVLIGGGDLLSEEANHAIQDDLTLAEELSIPITLVVLVFIFAGVIAASLPVLSALGTVLGGYGILMTYSAFAKLDGNAVTVVSLLGLALSIDYGLLIVARYREELTRTTDRVEAVRRTWQTAGRTILFSGLTVVGALASLIAFDVDTLREMGISAVATTLMAILAALTLTPAMLGLAGDRLKPSEKQVAREAARSNGVLDSGFFAGLARATQRLPILAILACAALLLLIASPVRNTVVRVPQLEALPTSLASVQVSEEMASKFGITSADPAVKMVARMSTADLQAYAARWSNDPAVTRVEPPSAVNPNLSTVVFDVNGDRQGSAAQDLVHRLRADRPAGVESWVAGDAAMLVDLDDRVQAGLPLAVAITAVAMLVLLFLMTGSVVIPIKALVMNAISLGATFGVLVAMFQEGHLAGLLDMRVVGGLSPYMIAIVFAFAFGLSMDYEVFLLSRIKEYADAGVDPNAAVRGGLQRSGRIITSAALLMLIVFACFATAKTAQIQEIGIGLFVAVLIDATLVRCVLVPATMSLLGKAAWWAPAPLRRFQARYGLSETAATESVTTGRNNGEGDVEEPALLA